MAFKISFIKYQRTLKMLKINKSVHFNILCIFAVVFVCVYLYYTITDVKKIASQVNKHSQDMNNIITSLATLTKELGDLKKKVASGGTAQCSPPPKPIVENVQVTPQVTIKEEVTGGHEEDDTSSVDTMEVKNLLGDIPDDEEEEDNIEDIVADVVATTVVEPTIKTFKDMTFEELKKESYDDIKKYCKDNGLNSKGTKDVLIQRISESA